MFTNLSHPVFCEVRQNSDIEKDVLKPNFSTNAISNACVMCGREKKGRRYHYIGDKTRASVRFELSSRRPSGTGSRKANGATQSYARNLLSYLFVNMNAFQKAII